MVAVFCENCLPMCCYVYKEIKRKKELDGAFMDKGKELLYRKHCLTARVTSG